MATVTMAKGWSGGRNAILDSARTTLAVLISALAARQMKLPEYYWAPISAIVIMQSTIDPLTLSWQRFAGTALGALLGSAVAEYFGFRLLVYGLSVFLCGVLCWMLRISGAFRFAAITISIILLIGHTNRPWIVGLHRFIEVSVGIAVGLAVSILWKRPAPASS